MFRPNGSYAARVKGKCRRIVIGAFLFLALQLSAITGALATWGPPSVTTLRQDSSTTDAILNAEVTPGLNDTVAWFEWGPTTNVELRTPFVQLPQTTNAVRISALATNLTPYADYYFHGVASNKLGKGLYYVADFRTFRAVPRFVQTSAPQAYWSSIACSS